MQQRCKQTCCIIGACALTCWGNAGLLAYASTACMPLQLLKLTPQTRCTSSLHDVQALSLRDFVSVPILAGNHTARLDDARAGGRAYQVKGTGAVWLYYGAVAQAEAVITLCTCTGIHASTPL